MAGCLAGLLTSEATIFEANRELGEGHQALLRFRSGQIGQLTGIPFIKVTVQKAIWSDGTFHQPNPRLINLYARKVIGTPQQRSIHNIEPQVRWIAPDNFHHQMISQLGPRIQLGMEVSHLDQLKGMGPIISTLPLFYTAKLAGVELKTHLHHDSIQVTRYTLPGADVYQTIYFPDRSTNVYRASISKDILIIEAMGPASAADKTEVVQAFGLEGMAFEKGPVTTQRLGKIIPLPERERKDLLYHLSTEHNIWSLGRYACWRNVVLDDVLNDVFKIRQMIGQSRYDLSRRVL